MPTPRRDHLLRTLGIDVPVVLAPMGGGPGTAALAAAVSEAGGLGSLAGGYLTVDRLRAEVEAVRARTSRPFAVNVFAPEHPAPSESSWRRALVVVNRLRDEVGLPPLDAPPPQADDLDAKVDLLTQVRPRVVSFTFGLLPDDAASALADAGCLLMGTATNPSEAVALVGAGCDVVCAQGAEAGGHRGTFLGSAETGQIGTIALVPAVRDAVEVPVVAAGGIADHRGVAAVLALGADAAQVGTAFLLCDEAGTAPAHREVLRSGRPTALTAQVTGKTVRGITNRLMRELAAVDVPPYPVMHALTAELRRTAAARGIAELMSLWAGQAAPMARPGPAADVVRALAGERPTA